LLSQATALMSSAEGEGAKAEAEIEVEVLKAMQDAI
jgi:hypothetical protein